MVSAPRAGRSAVAGIAVGAMTVWGRDGPAGPPWSRPIEPPPAAGPPWPALTEALSELRASRKASGGALAVALLPPLVDVRPIALPPLALEEARRVIARTAARYFLGARDGEAQVIGLAPPRERPAAGGAPARLAAAAPARLIEAIHAAAREAGWTVRTIVPAAAAWQAAALAIWPGLRRGSHDLVVAAADRTELLRLEGGMLAAVRRFGDVSADLPALHEALVPDGVPRAPRDIVMLGSAARREMLARALHASGVRAMTPPAMWSALAEAPELAAATFASGGSVLELVPESVGRRREARRTSMTTGIAAAAVVLLGVAGALERWGVERELDQVRRERAALRPTVAALLATRDRAAATGRRLEELAQASRASPWSDVLVALTRTLPGDAHLTALRAAGDSLVIDGRADRAAGVFAALDAAPELSGVRSAAPVRRDLRDRDAAEAPEWFSIAARAVPGGDTARLAAVGSGRP